MTNACLPVQVEMDTFCPSRRARVIFRHEVLVVLVFKVPPPLVAPFLAHSRSASPYVTRLEERLVSRSIHSVPSSKKSLWPTATGRPWPLNQSSQYLFVDHFYST